LNDRKTTKRVTKRKAGSLDVHFGEKLQARRLTMVPKVSQDDIAKALGVSFQQVQKYEQGVNRMSAAMIVQIAQVLKSRRPVFFR
jgi:transcriptional regulator with XRE-family HTH domain